VSFAILSRNSIEVLGQLENLEVDAGLTYLDNEPLGRVQSVPLYSEEYRLLTSSDSPLGNRDSVTWAEVGKVPLCLLTPDMQNRRIIEDLLRQAGAEVAPTLESDSIIVLFAHVRTGRWASVMPVLHHGAVPVFVETEPTRLGLDPDDVRARITSRTRAMVVVHLFGIPSAMDDLIAIAREHELRILEDASHAHGATDHGRMVGTLGDAETAIKRKELGELLAMLDLAAVDSLVIERAKGSFAVNLRALDAIHVATAELLAAGADGEPLEFWTHDERQATAALSRGLTVRGSAVSG